MRPDAVLPVALVALALLAGCASPGDVPRPQADADVVAADEAAQAIDVQATATTGVIRGVVIDEAIRPVPGATVQLEGTDMQTATNGAGAFGFEGLEPGVYFVLASHANYTGARHSVAVEAGVSDPPPVRVLVSLAPRAAAYIEDHSLNLFVSGAAHVPVVGPYNVGVFQALGMGGWSYLFPVAPNGTVAQFEYDWRKTSDLAANGRAHATTHNEDRADIDDQFVTGPSPLVLRLSADSAELGSAHQVSGDLRAAPSAGLPAGFMMNQQVDCYIHVFHGFTPVEGWQFGRDGAHPVPSG